MFTLLLQKGSYPNEHMDNWEKFNETLLAEKEDFFSYLIIEDTSGADCEHRKRVFKDLA